MTLATLATLATLMTLATLTTLATLVTLRLHVNYRNDATTELGLCVGGKFRRYGAIYQSTLGRWVIMIRGLTH